MKTYADACGITRALDVIGERWAIPVVRELIFGPRRYSDLAATLPAVSTNILGSRLKELTHAGVVRKRRLRAPAAATVYELTAWGAALEPALIALGRWAAHTPVTLEEQAFSASSFALSLKTTFDSTASAGVDVCLRFIMAEDGEDVFDTRLKDATLSIQRTQGPSGATADGPAFTGTRIQATPKILAALIYQNFDLDEASRAGLITIDGPAEAINTFARCFTLPEPPTEGPS